jgi:hypothetical protein
VLIYHEKGGGGLDGSVWRVVPLAVIRRFDVAFALIKIRVN